MARKSRVKVLKEAAHEEELLPFGHSTMPCGNNKETLSEYSAMPSGSNKEMVLAGEYGRLSVEDGDPSLEMSFTITQFIRPLFKSPSIRVNPGRS